MTDANHTRQASLTLSGADETEEFLSRAYGTRMRIRSDDRSPRLTYRRLDAGSFSLDTIDQTAELDIDVDPLHKVVVDHASTAPVRRTCRGIDHAYPVGEIFLAAAPDQSYSAHLEPGEVTSCILNPDLLDRVAATAPGLRPQPVRFTGLDPQNPAATAHWLATRAYVAALLDDLETAAAPLLVASAAQLLVTATLVAFPNTALTDPTIEDRHDASTATLRRATTFIDENAARDITVAEIAAAAYVSIRAVQLAFRRHLGTTPLAYLRRVRLDHAHRELSAADLNITVGDIATRWGFLSHSRFTSLYKNTYGKLPSATLRGH